MNARRPLSTLVALALVLGSLALITGSAFALSPRGKTRLTQCYAAIRPLSLAAVKRGPALDTLGIRVHRIATGPCHTTSSFPAPVTSTAALAYLDLSSGIGFYGAYLADVATGIGPRAHDHRLPGRTSSVASARRVRLCTSTSVNWEQRAAVVPDTQITPVRPGIAYTTDEGEVIDLTEEKAAYLIASDSVVAKQWTHMSGPGGSDANEIGLPGAFPPAGRDHPRQAGQLNPVPFGECGFDSHLRHPAVTI